MAKVYGSSALNIGATSAINSSKGLFTKRPQHRNSGFHTLVRLKDSDVLCQCVPVSLYTDSISKSPLAQRGWVLQERLLAPRTAHFTKNQVFWECGEVVACEVFPEKVPEHLTTWPWISQNDRAAFLEKKPLAGYSWTEIVEQYSRCKLTFGKDKLVAISGVARAMPKNQHSEYLAGLWGGEDLIRQLHWRVIALAPRPLEYRGPSWSWASVDTPVQLWQGGDHFLPGREFIHARVIDTQLELAGPDQFGAVCSAKLNLKCDVLFRVTDKPLKGGFAKVEIFGKIYDLQLFYDCSDEPQDLFYLLPVLSIVKPRFGLFRETPNHFSRLSDKSCEVSKVDGLVLRRCGSGGGQYRRVGIFKFFDPVPKSHIQKDIHMHIIRLNSVGPLDLSDYQDVDPSLKGYSSFAIVLV